MRICNNEYCEWKGSEHNCVMVGDVGPLCPECNETTFEAVPHDYDDDAVCRVCNLDGAEADYYSKRGYAHEYPTLNSCPGRR